MTVCKCGIFDNKSRGAGMTDVLLAMAICAMSAPFVYNQIARTHNMIVDVRMANKVIASRGPILNFVRMHAASWPTVAQIKLSDEELAQISSDAIAGFIDKYSNSGATITDVYLAFDIAGGATRAANIARQIGVDAAIVGPDGIAYGDSFAVTAPDFSPGNLIYRVGRDITGTDTEKFLHRGTSGEDDLNKMMRDLNMGGHNVLNIGAITAKSAKATNASSTFITSDSLMTDNVYFSSGATIDGGDARFSTMRVTGDMTGFRTINAGTLNGTGFTTRGRIITDRAMVANSVNVSRNLTLKSDSVRTISGFDGISVSYVAAPFITTDEITFFEDFGITVSGELTMSTTPALKIGSWAFPSLTPPKFSEMVLERASMPRNVSTREFDAIMGDDWKYVGGTDVSNENI